MYSSDRDFGSTSIPFLITAGIKVLNLGVKFSSVLTKLIEILVQSWALVQELALK